MNRYAGLIAAAALLVGAPLALGGFDLALVTSALVFGLFGASTDLLSGYTGLPSFGQAAPFGMGAYAAMLVGIHIEPNAFLQLGAAVAAATVTGLVVGLLAMRCGGTYFLMLTLAFAEMLRARASTWGPVTGGLDGLAGPFTTVFGVELITPLDVYLAVAGVVVLGYLLLRAVARAPFGLALRGIREDEARMRALGYATTRYKLAAFVFAAAMAGVGGALVAISLGFVSPETLAISTSALALIVVVLGGQRTLWGAFLGALLVIFVRDRLPAWTEVSGPLLLGVLFVAVIYLTPNGIAGTLSQLRSRFRSSTVERK